jgi:hypothetical protein
MQEPDEHVPDVMEVDRDIEESKDMDIMIQDND